MSDSTSRSDGLCDRCSRFLHFKGGEHGFYAETTDDDGIVHIDFCHTRDGKDIREVESQFQLEDDYPAMTELKRSALRGCGFCHLLANAIEKQEPVNEKTKEQGEIRHLLIERGDILDDWLSIGDPCIAGVEVKWRIIDSKAKDGPSKSQVYHTNFKLLANQDSMATRYLRLLHVTFNPLLSCSEASSSIRQYLSDCSESHKSCADNGAVGHLNHQTLPSRLLRISKDQTGYRIWLVRMPQTTSSEPGIANPKYAALSYCWGSREFIKSTPENITDHYNSIRFSRLPQGFQDTVELCWRIGIFYLWIDSLCIIQGDQSDWDRESARMKDVYANAFLTIVLASTNSPLEGLSKGPTEHLQETRVSYRLGDDNGTEITYFIQSKTSVEGFDFKGFKNTNEIRSPYEYHVQSIFQSKWSERGWTFQENYMSARKLYICPGHTDFSCKTSCHFQGVLGTFKVMNFHRLATGDQTWYDLVSNYSFRELSRSEDRLPAISAIAAQKGEGLGDYVAGLWMKELEKGLLWTPLRPLIQAQRHTNYIGPTWSWCGYDGPISYESAGGRFELTRSFEILEIRCTPAEPSAIYGRLSTADGDKAYLRVRAKTVAVTAYFIEDKNNRAGFRPVMEIRGTRFLRTIFIDYVETEWFNNPQTAVVMLVASRKDLRGFSITGVASVGLLLRPTAFIGSVMTYERIGCVASNWDDRDMFKHVSEVQELCLV